MTTQEIAVTMVDLLREKKFIQAQTEYYHQDAFSIEPEGHPSPKTIGKTHLLEKERQFLKAIKAWHAFEVSEPLIAKNYFSLRMYSYVTLINGHSMELDEIIVYEVSAGKIINEQYFYNFN